MKTVVLKFGGTSVGNIERIKNVSNIIASYKKKNLGVIVVSSAMSGATNDLIKKTKQLSSSFDPAEYDVLLSSGEQVVCALIAGRLNHLGYKARSWMSWQIPIITEGPYSSSRIDKINKNKIFSFVKSGGIPIITGFQGINLENRITTLGRGGTDASAIMLAKFFNADNCDIYTDVDGVYTTDPKNHSKAKKIDKISYDEMLELSSLGAKVMQSSAVQTAMMYDIPLEVRSTFTDRKGTKIFSQESIDYTKSVTGVAYSKDDAKITVIGVEDRPGVAANIFEPLSNAQINVDMVIQNISSDQKTTDITFTVKRNEVTKTKKILKDNNKIEYKEIIDRDKVAKISIVGAGMVSTPGVTYKMFRALSDEGINILAISTSEIKISVIIEEENTLKAVKKLHTIFDLD